MTTALAGQYDEASRVRLAASPEATQAALGLLAADPSVTVRAAVATNDLTPPDVLASLATDGDERVRMLLASKLARCASGSAEDHRQRGAVQLLEQLVRDEAGGSGAPSPMC